MSQFSKQVLKNQQIDVLKGQKSIINMRNDIDLLIKSDHKNHKLGKTKNTDLAENYFYQDFVKEMPLTFVVDSNLKMNEHY